MGGSSGEPSSNSKGIDASVGGLVWVRRRNGSWWPGRIVGLDELSEGCLVSPRSGTPVKLLGREDASIDWYNLEKSKRVKAFRCGEYDDCIEKAKAAANSSKKAVKYARREDAILHALEIESARLGKDHPYYFTRMDSPSIRIGTSATESPTISRSDGKETDGMSDNEIDGDSHSTLDLSYSGTYFDEPSHDSSFKVKTDRGMRRRTPNDSEDDGNEGIKRMRGLKDLGMSVVSDKKDQSETAQQENGLIHDASPSNGSPMNGGKGYASSSLKRKRSQVAHVHDFLKKKNRRRPLTKVLESTVMVSVPITCDQFAPSCGSLHGGFPDTEISGMEAHDSKRSFSSTLGNNSECTGPTCENGISANIEHSCNKTDLLNTHHKTKKEPSYLPEPPEDAPADGLFEVPFIAEDKKSSGFSPTYTPGSTGRSQVGAVGRQSSQSSQVEAISLQCDVLNESVVSISSAATLLDNVTQRIEKSTSKWQSKGKRNSRHLSNKKRRRSIGKSSSIGRGCSSNTYLGGLEHDQEEDLSKNTDGSLPMPNCEDKKLNGVCDWGKRASPSHRGSQPRKPPEPKTLPEVSLTSQRLLPYRHSRFTVHPRYEKDEFPFRSFSSSSESSLYNIELEVNASYRPPHVPLVSLMSKLNGKAIVGHPLAVEVLDDSDCKEVALGGGVEMSLGGKRSLEPIRDPAKIKTASRARSSSRKKSKSRKTGLMSKKMRKLSSLTGQKRGEDVRRSEVEKPRSPIVTCIPLKIVFGRINEAVNGSLRLTNRATKTGSAGEPNPC